MLLAVILLILLFTMYHLGDSAVASIVGSDAINASLQAGLLTASRISFMFLCFFKTELFLKIPNKGIALQ